MWRVANGLDNTALGSLRNVRYNRVVIHEFAL